ncbi:MAG TPA: hemerythrin domain-containing protein [Sphingomicrobium sp.]|nr:hemerythrin domain-containing protein [Sphingomicrobium sp.]
MATRSPSRTTSRSSNSSSSRAKSASSTGSNGNSNTQSRRTVAKSDEREQSAFAFGRKSNSGRDSNGAFFGTLLAGAAIGLAANYGRKLLMQGLEAQAGDWDEILATEHDAALAIFDRMLATDSTQTFKRKMLLMKLTHALDKHAHQEEMVVYPALRQANERHDADLLETEHGEVKTYLYALDQMGADSPLWLDKVREFRSFISKHMHMEEEQVFPRFKQDLTEEQNDKITSLVNRDGFWMA